MLLLREGGELLPSEAKLPFLFCGDLLFVCSPQTKVVLSAHPHFQSNNSVPVSKVPGTQVQGMKDDVRHRRHPKHYLLQPCFLAGGLGPAKHCAENVLQSAQGSVFVGCFGGSQAHLWGSHPWGYRSPLENLKALFSILFLPPNQGFRGGQTSRPKVAKSCSTPFSLSFFLSFTLALAPFSSIPCGGIWRLQALMPCVSGALCALSRARAREEGSGEARGAAGGHTSRMGRLFISFLFVLLLLLLGWLVVRTK